jgi:NADPH-dependent 2,4-dienoyl-CoA reductase/sulfur reductase-like enzyme
MTRHDRHPAGRVALVGAELERPYERPPLSKDYLRGESARETVYVHPASYHAEQDVELRLGRTAISFDPARREIALDDGERRVGAGQPIGGINSVASFCESHHDLLARIETTLSQPLASS